MNQKTGLTALRGYMAQHKLDAIIVPRADAHQNEYVAANAERLAYITGFTGSAGMAIVLRKAAALFVDSRYTVQAPMEVDTSQWTILPIEHHRPSQWLGEQNVASIAIDPWQVTKAQLDAFQAACPQAVWHFPEHLIDDLWQDKPVFNAKPIFTHPTAYAGVAAADKIAVLQAAMQGDAWLLSHCASVCWLLNIRGYDVDYTPLVLAYALVPKQGNVTVFYDASRVPDAVRASLPMVTWQSPATMPTLFKSYKNRVVMLDKDTASYALHKLLAKAKVNVQYDTDPCLLPKAVKNLTEQAAAIAAHQRDGRALTRFLRWLEQEAPIGALTELDIAAKLEALRAEQPLFQGLSFPTIAGSGANGAIVHYRATPERHRQLEEGDLLLLDSGAQYLDGTTDVTRTVYIGHGQPTQEQKQAYTRVLKGHIALAMARFPEGTTGAQLDVLARYWLWQAGLDYGHGTGHGVGSFLGVHEGPQGISRRSHTPLQAGMILSNEPGYYKEGAYGIRLENLIMVEEAQSGFHTFRTLTLAPFDTRLIDKDLLTEVEQQWLAAYHKAVAENLTASFAPPQTPTNKD